MALVAAARSEQPGGREAHAAAVDEHAEDSEEGHEERAAEAEAEVTGGGAVRGQSVADAVDRDALDWDTTCAFFV